MAKNYGNGVSNPTLEQLIDYYQGINPNLAAQDVRFADERFNGDKSDPGRMHLNSVDGTMTYTPAIVGQNMEAENGNNPFSPPATQDPEFKKRLSALRWMMNSEGLDRKKGYMAKSNPDPIFGPITELINPTDNVKARLNALTMLARDR